MDPLSQELQLQRAGVPLNNIHRDVGVSGTTGTQEWRGWHRLNGRLAGGDILVVVAIDRIGRRWPDTIKAICDLRDRGVKVRSLAEAQWTKYLEADEGSPESFFGQVLVMFAAWVADQELESIKRRTREGMERARQQPGNGGLDVPPFGGGPEPFPKLAADYGDGQPVTPVLAQFRQLFLRSERCRRPGLGYRYVQLLGRVELRDRQLPQVLLYVSRPKLAFWH